MPFESKAQRAFMFAKHPAIAKRWQEETAKNKKLPEHVGMAYGGQVCPSCGYAYGGEVDLGEEIQSTDELSLDPDEEEARRRQFADALRRRM